MDKTKQEKNIGIGRVEMILDISEKPHQESDQSFAKYVEVKVVKGTEL